MGGENSNPKTCFVVMGFGKKTDFETGRVLDLDKSYRNMIKPAVEAAGLKCIRADEIVHSGLIDAPMYEQLLNADVVVADLSTSNKNAFYELGVRHALRPFTTIIISEDGIKTFPFDISHIAVRQYHHLGDDIGFDEVMRFRAQLTNAITEIMRKSPQDKDSPVYAFINELTPPALATVVKEKVQEAMQANATAIEAIATITADQNSNAANEMTHSILMQQVDQAQATGNWMVAKTLLTSIRQMKLDEMQRRREAATVDQPEQQEDSYLLQRLALATYKSEFPTDKAALAEAQQLLAPLAPGTSNDTETLGLWGAIHKRLWAVGTNTLDLDEAIRAYERGFYIRNDYYNGINYAFLLNVRVKQVKTRAEAVADFVEARRVRQEVIEISKQWLMNNPELGSNASAKVMKDYLTNWYWVKATLGEAYIGIGENDQAEMELQEAYTKAPETWMKKTTEDQLAQLKVLLADSPLKYVLEKDV